MTDWIALQARATDLYDDVLSGVTDWDADSPCISWTAREVLAHVVDEQLWVPGLLAGGTVDEVGQDLEEPLRRLDGMSGPELVDEFRAVRAPVAAAWRGTCSDGGEGTAVNLSYGSAPAGHYLAQQTFDLAVHAWDIAASQGRDLPWGDDLEWAVLEFVRADLAEDPAPDLFAPPVPGFEGAGVPVRHTALALTGRDPERWSRG